MEIEAEVKDGPPITGVVRLKGLIETHQARELRKALDQLDGKSIGRLLFDMSEVPFISSTGISLLVSYANSKRGEWGSNPVVLAGLQKAVENAMQMLGVSRLFLLMPDMASALDKFRLLQD